MKQRRCNQRQLIREAIIIQKHPADHSKASGNNNENYQELIDSKLSNTNSMIGDVASFAADTITGDANNDNVPSTVNQPNNRCSPTVLTDTLGRTLLKQHLFEYTKKYLNEARAKKSFKNLDQQIENIWKSITPKGLFTVLFSGDSNKASSSNTASGLAVLQIIVS